MAGSNSSSYVRGRRRHASACQRPRVNSQWSVWYCFLALAFQIYIIATSIKRFTRYVSLPWPPQAQPYFELNAYVAFIGAAVVLMPFFVISALMKVGNYANDGHKLGDEEPDNVVYQNLRRRRCFRWVKSIWKHGGPVAPLIHLTASMCLLLPRLLIEAQLIKHGFLSKGTIWRTDLDFLVPHRDRLVTLRFLETLNETEVWGQQGDEPPRTVLRSEVLAEENAVVSSEFINYILALLIYAIRYPAVFWNINKCFGFLFSFHLFLTAVQQVLTFIGFTVLYKVHVCGPRDVLLRFSTLLLNVKFAVLSFLLYSAVLTISGTALYFYGLQKYKEWLDSRIQCHLIRWKQQSRRMWGVAPHLLAFFSLISVIVCGGPLMYDFTLVYCGSLDGVILAAVMGTIVHLFLWIVLWLILTIKQRWAFDSLAAAVDLQLNGFRGGGQEAPLLVIDHGHTYQIREKDSKKAILSVVHKSTAPMPKLLSPAEDDDIYWLKPKSQLPKDGERGTWHKNQRKSPGAKHKVIFQDGLIGSTATCKRSRSLKKSPKAGGRFKKQNVKFEELSDSDDGDYATLRDMTVLREDGTSEDHMAQRLWPRVGTDSCETNYKNFPSPQGCLDQDLYGIVEHDNCVSGHLRVPVSVHRQPSTSTRSTDSGVARGDNGDVTPRSGSISESSTSPEKGTSESSSGVHSAASFGDKRASSLENIALGTIHRPTWKSMSLQRTAVPPPVVPQPKKFFKQTNNPLIMQRNHTDEPLLSRKSEHFGRATNIRLTSFTEQPDYSMSVGNSAISTIRSPQHHNAIVNNSMNRHYRRDSANYSLASSAESDNGTQHS